MTNGAAALGPGDDGTFRVLSCERVTPAIADIWLAPTTAPIEFLPGQYVLLSDTAFRVPPRSYSIANAPRPDGRLRLLVTQVDGGCTSGWAGRLRVDDEVALEGPFGSYVTEPDRAAPLLLLAAGSGLAPNRALVEATVAGPVAREVTLVHSVRDVDHTIDRDHFERLEREWPGFRYVVTLTRDPAARWHRRIPQILPDLVETLSGWDVFAAGPGGFVAGCATVARALGATDVHTEEFFVEP